VLGEVPDVTKPRRREGREHDHLAVDETVASARDVSANHSTLAAARPHARTSSAILGQKRRGS
jgi:hypothetical protein